MARSELEIAYLAYRPGYHDEVLVTCFQVENTDDAAYPKHASGTPQQITVNVFRNRTSTAAAASACSPNTRARHRNTGVEQAARLANCGGSQQLPMAPADRSFHICPEHRTAESSTTSNFLLVNIEASTVSRR